MIPVYILIGVVVLVIIWWVASYNGLVRLKNGVDNAWSQIDVQLKRRHDLIPNLVETAKGYMTHERETFETIARARSLAQQAKGVGEAVKAEQALTTALSGFFAVAENYPELKANQNFLALQEELTSTENKIGFARQFYNDSAQQYNTSIESVPTNIVASFGHFQKRDYFIIENNAEREVPKVSFS